MACEIPDNPMSSCPEQHEFVAIDFSGADTVAVGEQLPDRTTVSAPAIRLVFSGFSVEIQNSAACETIRNTIAALQQLC